MSVFVEALQPTSSHKTYACKYQHLCPTLLPKFNSTHVKNLRYGMCIIADVGGCLFRVSCYQISASKISDTKI
jgi:hypothetical protein